MLAVSVEAGLPEERRKDKVLQVRRQYHNQAEQLGRSESPFDRLEFLCEMLKLHLRTARARAGHAGVLSQLQEHFHGEPALQRGPAHRAASTRDRLIDRERERERTIV